MHAKTSTSSIYLEKLEIGLPSSRGLLGAALDDVMFRELDKETALSFILPDNVLIYQKSATFHTWTFYLFALTLLNEMRKK